MVKCKRHIYEVGGGVCASCLRDRLLALAADPDALPTAVKRRSRSAFTAPPPPPPLQPDFPRSVSPYVSRRRSMDADASARMSLHLQRFNSTPQARSLAGGDIDPGGADHRRKRFSLFPYLPRNDRSDREEADPATNGGKRGQGTRSWLLALIGGRCRKPAAADHGGDGSAQGARRAAPCRPIERGMSPVRYSCDDDEDGFSSDSGGSPPWRQPLPTPMRGDAGHLPACRRQRRGAGGVTAGFAMCLSPLMRANPNYRQSPAADGGEPRHHRHGSAGAAAWLAPSRSRKLAYGPTTS